MPKECSVSIPYSSGLRFRDYLTVQRLCNDRKKSQSLIHQVSDSEKNWRASQGLYFILSLNPLFIRSQIQRFKKVAEGGANAKGLNPLFIRSQIQRKV